MKRNGIRRKSEQTLEVAVQKRALQRIEDEAARVMWEYYRDHRGILIDEIKEFRKEILASLIKGTSPKEAFAPYVITEKLTKVKRRKPNEKMPAQSDAQVASVPLLIAHLPVRRVTGSKF